MTEFTLISLVSGQPIPNVMAVLQDDRYFTHLEFIVSADKNKHDQYDKEFDEAYERIKEFLEQGYHNLKTRSYYAATPDKLNNPNYQSLIPRKLL